jgi:hypothetical protein
MMMPKLLIIAAIVAVAFCMACLLGATLAKAGETVVDLNNLDIGDLAVDGFELMEKGKVEIFSVGAKVDYSKALYSYGWIIDAEDRELVWSMNDDCYDMSRISDDLYECEESVRLRPGKYEVYYYVGERYSFVSGYDISIDDLGDIISVIGDIITDDDKDHYRHFDEDEIEELGITVSTEASARAYIPVFDEPDGSIVYINRPERDEYHSQGFTLNRTTDLYIHAIGEYSSSYELFVDGGWIIDAETRETVWSMDKWNSDRAGGADKNRMVEDDVTLPAGNYIAYYATDDSHDPGEWNSPPPADAMNYGMVITTENPGDVAEYDEKMHETPIVKITRVRDDEFEKAGFTLKHDAKIHIVGLGERDYGLQELVDYGWIVNAEDLDKVWEMTADNTGFAGGGAKNCLFDGIIDLPAGDYLVYYRTDGSHSYRDWNVAAPHDKAGWGISLYGVGDDFSESSFEIVDEFEPSGNILVNLTGLGDHEDISRRFTLDKDTKVRIMALGEGKDYRMYDYGWIEDEDGEVVWEMTYRRSKHGGGAKKNRRTVANLTLDKGRYTVYFVTDGSHSFRDFNASPPDDPERWGIVVTQK